MLEQDGLADAVARLQLNTHTDNTDNTPIDEIDTILFQDQPIKRQEQSKDDTKQHLGPKMLVPSLHLSHVWLNHVQQRESEPADYTELFEIADTISRTVTRFQRLGLEGKVTGYKNVTVPASSSTAKNSTSMLRKPGDKADFVRGAAGFFPFSPGGLDGIQATAAVEEQAMRALDGPPAPESSATKLNRIITMSSSKDGLMEIAPGADKGISFSPKPTSDSDEAANDIEQMLDQDPDDLPGPVAKERADADMNSDDKEVEDEEFQGIDAILPVEFPSLEPHGALAPSSSKKVGREWAHMVDMKKGIPNFHELVPDMARTWPFELDTFQKEAVYHLENGDSVFVAAHTSAGKTVVAEYAIALAQRHKTKAIYTSPIKALSNQKYRDFKGTFNDVGILTGDVQINPEGSCLIMTTEILRSMLYRGADVIRDVEYVIFDEVHYVNDSERGVVWEEVIIMLPDHVSLILLSATVPNTYEFASWVGRTKKRDIYVISTSKRPVPLEHYLWAGQNTHMIVDSNKKFIEAGWKEADLCLRQKKTSGPPARGGAAGGARGGARGGAQRGANRGGGQRGSGRGGAQRGGRGGAGGGSRGGRSAFSGRSSAAQDKTTWTQLVTFLRKKDLLPACIFVFSKKRCETNADALENQDFTTNKEKNAIHMIIEKSVARLKPEDRHLPQIERIRELLRRGIAVHHSGLLPIIKELVEILFAQTLVKVLFATETFAMGLNLPTRTVVFSGFQKHDGTSFRNLIPGEYTQMSGRAGRRGLDPVGSVIIVPTDSDEAPPASELQRMMLAEPSKLQSQFRLTYTMILNLLRVEALKIEEMIKRSFSEHATQQLLPQHEKGVNLAAAQLDKVKREACEVCDVHMDTCHQAAQDFKTLTTELYNGLLLIPFGRKMFCQGRLILYQKDGIRTAGLLLGEGAIARAPTSTGPMLNVLEIRTHRETRNATDILPAVSTPWIRNFFTPLPQAKKHIQTKTGHVPLGDVECLTQYVVKGVLPNLFNGGEDYQKAKVILHGICSQWTSNHWDEMDMSKIKNFQLIEIMNARNTAINAVIDSPASQCPNFVKHFAMCNDQWVIKEQIAELKQQLSDQNLQLLPDYEQRLQVLKELDFIDPDTRIQLKGKVACEIRSGDELILTELVLENVLRDYEPVEIAALLSCFVFQDKTYAEPRLTEKLAKGCDKIVEIAERVRAVQIDLQVIDHSYANDFVSRKPFGLVEVVYEWASGMSFKNITDLTDVMEGSIVRTITRLDETCREVKNAARIIGDPELYLKMESVQELIKRDITAVASLYM